MNILFLSLSKVWNINEKEIYSDLLREFIKNGHRVYVVTPVERRYRQNTQLIEEDAATILKIKTLNIQKTNLFEKGIGTVLLERQFICAIKKYYSTIKFDLVLYATPPITLVNPIKYIKKKCGALSYLLLKDIFPQNAVDLEMMKKTGPKGLLYRYFRNKEKRLYAISDKIGCMSEANADYILKHNPQINSENVEICPNSIEIQDMRLSYEEKIGMRKKYGIPTDKKVFVYGGNLGKPQGIPFIIDCLREEKENDKAFFLIVGDGTEYSALKAFIDEEKPGNVKLEQRLPKDDYDKMVAACDVGLIFLDHRFTIPNFPSRLLSYLQAGLPVLACTDPNTDMGKVITNGGFGWWCESDDAKKFKETASLAIECDSLAMGEKAFIYLRENYTADKAYQTIMKNF